MKSPVVPFSRILAAIAILFLWASIVAADPDSRARSSIVLSRDPSGTPLTGFKEYIAGRDPSAPFQASMVSQSRAGGGTVMVVVEGYLYYNIIPAITQYSSDLLAAGYNVQVHLSSSSGTAADLRSYIQSQSSGLVGVVLVGNLPAPWFEIGYDFDGGDPDALDNDYADFPCDFFYMDLDGTWADNLTTAPFQAGVYDSHTAGSGDMDPEIWVSRLTPLPLGGNETTLMTNYFTKDHSYREGDLRLPDRALVYIDDDWVSWASEIESAVASAYPARVPITDSYTTCRNDYRYTRFFEGYDWMHVMLHSSNWEHFFKVGGSWEMSGGSYATVIATDVRDLMPMGIFYNLYTCSAARYTSWPYIAGYYIFNGNGTGPYGLGAIGTTKTGGMWDYSLFYGPLAQSGSLGSAFKDWLVSQAPYDSIDVKWFYGMTLLGDGALAPHPRVVASSPAAYQTDVPVTADVSFEFDRTMLATSLSTNSFSAHGSQSGRHAGTYTCDTGNRRIVFNPTNEFIDGEVVSLIMSRKVRSSDNIGPAPQIQLVTTGIGNPGAGTYSPWNSYTLGASDVASNIACTDLNGDGFPDLATVVDRPAGDQLAILLNNQAGGFAAAVYYAALDGARWFVTGDFDADYDTDVVLCTTQNVANNFSVYKNNGNGTFAAAANFNGGAYPTELQSGDFDGDGDLDFYSISNSSSDTIIAPRLFLNNGSGSFSQGLGIGWLKPTGFTYRAEAAADVDGDGDLDLIGLGTGPGVADDSLCVFQNFDANWRVQPLPGRLYVRNGPSDLCAGDFDMDGNVDAAVVTSLENSLMIFHGNGDGTFSFAEEIYHWSDAASCITCGDWDGDGDIDLAIGAWFGTTRRIQIIFNDGDGTFTLDNVCVVGADGICGGDLDRDGDQDLASVRLNTVYTSLNASGDYTPPARVIDLVNASARRDTAVTFTWTAPGDDGRLGRANEYRMRYSTSPVVSDTTAWWGSATPVSGLPAPLPSGSGESCAVSGLLSRLYYFMLITGDEMPNWSAYSNVVALDLRDPNGVEQESPSDLTLRCRMTPNPFSIRTLVEYCVPRPGPVRLTVYDLLGRRVATLLDQAMPAGTHTLTWNSGKIPGGVYFCELESGGSVVRQRVVIAR
jgi:hypothetical protein